MGIPVDQATRAFPVMRLVFPQRFRAHSVLHVVAAQERQGEVQVMKSASRVRLLLRAGTAIAGLMVPLAAQAQAVPDPAQAAVPTSSGAAATPQENAAAPQDASEASPDQGTIQDIIVTGSRLQGGFSAPTPITQTSSDELKLAAPSNLADGLNQLPQFSFRSRPSNPNTAVGVGPGAGQNVLSMRGLGGNRTLVLLDGRRVVASNAEGSVDINMIPQGLIQRVDVVTGGASAAYGSDAISGVVNFVLDRKFTGFRADISGGLSTHGDLPATNVSLAGGVSLLDDRLHIILGGDFAYQKGIRADRSTGRDWFDRAAGRVPNPIAGASPSFITIPDIRSATGSYGGLITSGPLAGRQFLPDGTLASFDFGSLRSGVYQSGGDGPRLNIGFAPDQIRVNSYTRVAFEATPDLTVFAEGGFALSHVTQGAFINQHIGAANQFTIFNDNAFLPTAVRQQMAAANITSFTMGRFERDFPLVEIESRIKNYRGVIGVEGKLGGSWHYDAAYTYGRTDLFLSENNVTNNRNLYAAVDAVRDPATGNIVCRSRLAGLDPNCVPLNLFGEGAPSAAAINYVTGDSYKTFTLQQHDIAFNVRGDLGESFSLGAGPISIAAGAEYRKDIARQTTDPLSPLTTTTAGLRGAPASQNNRPGTFNFHNPSPLSGSINVKEAYLEIGVPVLADLPFAKRLDLNGAVRYADYSTSGGVTTWKGGFNYLVVEDLRLRLTRSRDIRGPNTSELFDGATQGNSVNVYKGVPTQTLNISSGNPNLRPEVADTLTFGAVLQPRFIPGLQVSLDRFDIKIRDAIAKYSQPETIRQCDLGNAVACAQIQVTPTGTLILFTPTLNLNRLRRTGYDFELSYRRDILGGNVLVRALVSRMTKAETVSGSGLVTPELGTPVIPKWRGTLQLTYDTDRWSIFAQERFIGKSLVDPTLVQGVTLDDNTYPAIAYTDLTFTYKLDPAGSKGIFLTVNNLFDKDPPIGPGAPTSFSKPTNDAYDTIGRFITLGARFRF